MSDYLNIQNLNFNFLGTDTRFKGTLYLSGVSKISSYVEGELIVDDLSDLSLEPGGQIIGKVNCHNFKISGKFTGKIKSSGNVIIYPQACVTGEIISSNLLIHRGAHVEIKGHTLHL